MKKGLLVKLAELISIILNPFLLGLIIIVMAVLQSGMPATTELAWLITVIFINGIVIALIYWYMTNKGFIFDESIDNKKIKRERLVLLLIVLGLVLLELISMILTQIYMALFIVLVGGIFTIIIGLVITNYWKISWHSAMMTFFTTMFVMMEQRALWVMVGLLVLIVWSRLVLKRHNIWQLMGGIIVSALVMYITLFCFKII